MTTSSPGLPVPIQTLVLWLRCGLGTVFVIGGLSKLGQLLDPAAQAAILANYWGPGGYVNQFFIDYMFGAGALSPWWFLTTLSAFELLSGIAFIVGFAIRPLSLFYGFLLWTFVAALPVVTAPGVVLEVKTHTAPAILVQIRDIALSGMMFVLYNLGSGAGSVDKRLFGLPALRAGVNWDHLGLLLRLSIALPLLVGGMFAGKAYITSFAVPAWLLLSVALLLIVGNGARLAGYAVSAIMLWFMVHKFNVDKSLIANLNGFKREFAFVAGGMMLGLYGGGSLYTMQGALNCLRGGLRRGQTEVSASASGNTL